MENEDEWDGGIADEDLLTAFDFVPSSNGPFTGSSSSSNQTNQLAASSDRSRHIGLPPASSSLPNVVPDTSHVSTAIRRNGGNGPPSFRQTTLWGTEVAQDHARPSRQPNARLPRADRPPEEPSHHELDRGELTSWIYPTNLGATRDYQYSIVKNSLFNNTLVALPTGLGKTFIAATVMLNFYRWTKSAKIVFVAPTKPLVAQQIDACYNTVGIPRSDTTLLTGATAPALRVTEWEKRRVFFMTPQTLLNDLSHGYADPKSIALLVVDEAHRAVGEYAYAKATKLIRRFSKSFRVLALTATPGSKIETVQEVIDNLGISHCEIRTEESLDIRQYVHQRNIQQIVLDLSDEILQISKLFTEALKPMMERLTSQNIYYGRNPMALTAYGLIKAQKEWFATRGRNANQGVQFMMRSVFGVLTSLAHSIKLLNFHGIRPFYDNLVDFRNDQEAKGEKGSKYKRQLIQHPGFQEMMNTVSQWLKMDSFIGHPKLTALTESVLNHFMDRGEASATRVIVFSEYRDSAEDIVRILNGHRPLIKASIFVGQADGKRNEGMKQAQQLETIENFKKGEFNVLVATSIGEEGLDIGQVDLIVCYDASASPIRMLQRMGRTGRKRSGNIILLLMRGKEEDQFAKSKDSYEKMQQLICEGSRFNFRFDLSTRILPREIRPEVDQRHVEIPIENTQDHSLPEPKTRRATAVKKKPPKKFHLPDDVEIGFQTAARLMAPALKTGRTRNRPRPEADDLVDVPNIESVVLTIDEEQELDRSYRDLPFNHGEVEETDMPDLTSHPEVQRQLQPTVNLKHGDYTRRCVSVLGKIGSYPDSLVRPCRAIDESNYLEIPAPSFADSAEGTGTASGRANRSRSFNRQIQPVEQTPCGKRKRVSQSTWQSSASPGPEDATTSKQGVQRRRSRTQSAKRIKMHARGGGIGSQEIGDDCDRDSDLVETEGSDHGSDLLDFLVEDNEPTSSLVGSPTGSAEEISCQGTARKPYPESLFYQPEQFSATQESEEIPPLAILVDNACGGRRSEANTQSASLEPPPKGRAARSRRAVIADDDSDF